MSKVEQKYVSGVAGAAIMLALLLFTTAATTAQHVAVNVQHQFYEPIWESLALSFCCSSASLRFTDVDVIVPDGSGGFATNTLHFKRGLYTGKTAL